MRRAPVLFLALAVATPMFSPMVSATSPQDDCGPGVEAIEIDGLVLCTHGDDVPPPGVDTSHLPSIDELWQGRFGAAAKSRHHEPATAAFAPGTTDSAAPCRDDGVSGPRVQLVYARAADVAGRHGPVVPLIQQYAADADSIVNASAGRVGDGRRIRYVTGRDCKPAVLDMTLTTTGDDSFENTVSELRAQGLTSADRKYLVFVDAAVGICGLGQMYLDDRPGPDNANNSGRPMYSRVDTSCWQHAAAHELLHTLGAVQNSAPNATGAGHCTDEVDVMCYRDEPTTTTRQVCNRAGQVDCNNDDYYHPNPEAGSYLATNWNVANSRFLDPVAAPPPPSPTTVTVPAIGFAGVPWTVRAEVASADATVLWSSTRTDCVFSSPSAPDTSWLCPATAQGAAEITLHVTERGVVTPYATPVTFAAPSAPRTAVVTLTTSRRSVVSSKKVTLTATVADAHDGVPVYGIPVTYWAQDARSEQWRPLAESSTSAAGKATLAVLPTRNTAYIARIETDAAWAAASSPHKRVVVRSKVTARVRTVTSRTASVVKIAGKVSPDKSGQVVTLERYSDRRWVKVMTRRIRDSSRYVFRLDAGDLVRQRVRVVKAGDADNAKGVTRPMVVRIR